MESNVIYIPIVLALIGLIFMVVKMLWVKKQNPGSDRMQDLSKSIKEGALAFLNAEYRLLAGFVVIAGIALFVISLNVDTTSWMIVPAFIIGAIFSALAGNIGMRIATDANARTAEAAKTSLPQALKVSFSGGTVMGLGVAGLAVLGLSLLFSFFLVQFMTEGGDFYVQMTVVLETLLDFRSVQNLSLYLLVLVVVFTPKLPMLVPI